MNEDLHRRIDAWIERDPDERDRSTLRDLVDRGEEAELQRLFASPLTFGTAGLRGPERPGPAGMNRATVRRATQGVLAWLRTVGVDATRGVVVGRDARRGSERFNDEVVAVLLGGGARVYEMPSPLPTPFVPYAVRALGAAAGIMITASHNPPEDNGYKLYAADGAQIVPPDDEIVERAMRSAGPAQLLARDEGDHHVVAPALLEAYHAHALARFAPDAPSDLAIAYTPLHGVGGAPMTRLLADAGFRRVTPVVAQFAPDGTFPTLPFPNPEEPGALDLAVATADAVGADLVIANDPDADRLGAAVRGEAGWRVLNGNEIGALLASFLLEGIASRGELVGTTIVSSSLLPVMAAAAGVECHVTLTGFKWLARSAGAGVLGFGYEEALGFAVDPSVHDKDGLTAGLALARLASDLADSGGLVGRLDEIETRFGVHATLQVAVRVEGEDAHAKITAAVDALRDEPPESLGALAVSEVVDLAAGWHGLAPTEGVILVLGDRGRVVVRTSGTEPKVKAYLEITPAHEGSLVEQRDVARDLLEGVRASVEALLRR